MGSGLKAVYGRSNVRNPGARRRTTTPPRKPRRPRQQEQKRNWPSAKGAHAQSNDKSRAVPILRPHPLGPRINSVIFNGVKTSCRRPVLCFVKESCAGREYFGPIGFPICCFVGRSGNLLFGCSAVAWLIGAAEGRTVEWSGGPSVPGPIAGL